MPESLQVSRLTAEHLVDPLDLDTRRPRLSWVVADGRQSTVQAAYRITAPGWDTGRVAGGRCTDVEYEGPAAERVSWQVQVWTADGRTATSAPAVFERGLPAWTADWISHSLPVLTPDADRPASYLRTTFELAGPLASARLHVTAGGLYEAELNGVRVGADRLAPGWTDYSARVRSRTHDVTDLLRPGRNAVGVVAMDGWWSGSLGWERRREHYGPRPVARLELVVTLADGSQARVVTSPQWRAASGPIRAGDLLHGELYDARAELAGWSTADYDDSGWEHAWPDHGPAGQVVGTPCEPVRAVARVAAVALPGPTAPGSTIFDLGREICGWPRLRVRGAPGTIVRLRCAEALAGGGLYTANLRTAACTDTYVLRGGDDEEWEPRSTFRSFRYVEVTGAVDAAVHGVVAHTDARETGEFACSSADLNALWAAGRASLAANLVGLPTDCTQRDERLGWLADAMVMLRPASYCWDLGSFYAGWLADVRSGQSPAGAFPNVAPRLIFADDGAPGWGDAGVEIPWQLWQWYADRRVLEDNLDAMARWPQWVLAANPDRIWRERRGHDFGDWLEPGAQTSKELFATAWWARSARVVAAAAEVLGRRDVAAPAAALAEEVRAAFARRCVPATQTGWLLGLAFDLLPDRTGATAALVADVEQRGLTTGFQGTPYLLPALTAAGRADLAYRLVLAETVPSWLHMLRHGATTLWERWDSRTAEGFANPFMNSLCHGAFASVLTWLHETVGGLARDPAEPGWRRAVVRPRPGGGVRWARTSYDSRIGRYAVEWRLDGDRLVVDVEVPVAGTADVLGRLFGSGRHQVVVEQENARG